MRRTLLLALCVVWGVMLTGCGAPPARMSGNPVLEGWYADPEVAVFDGRFWVYPTTSARYDAQTYLDAFSSENLVGWTKHEQVLRTEDVKWAKRAVWAPAVVKNRGRYFLFFAANDIQKNGEPGGIGVAVSDFPEGPFRDYLGGPLIGRFHNGAQPIDQFVFEWRGGWYIVYGGWRKCNIARLTDDFRALQPWPDGGTFKDITPAGYVEGPVMFERQGRWYFMWSEGGWTGPDYSVAYAIAGSPLGPWERIGKVLQQDPAIATGAGHHSVLEHEGQWYILYHRRPLGYSDANARVVCIERMGFDGDGRILPVTLTNEGVPAVKPPHPARTTPTSDQPPSSR
jgi:beta-xylosidase